jgi:hypothetical protein
MSEITCPNKTKTRFSGSPDYFIRGLAPEDGYYDTNKWKALFNEVFIPAYLNGYSWIYRDKTLGSDTNLMKFGSMLEYINYKTVSFPPDYNSLIEQIFTSGINTVIILYTNYYDEVYKPFCSYVENYSEKYIGAKLTGKWHPDSIKVQKPDGSIVNLNTNNGGGVGIFEFASINTYVIAICDVNNVLGVPTKVYVDIDIINPIKINGEALTPSGLPYGTITNDYIDDLVSKYMLYNASLSLVTSPPSLSTGNDTRIVLITHENLYNKVGTMAYDAFGSDVIGDVYLLRSGLSILVPDFAKYPCFKIVGYGRDIKTLIDEWMSYACAGAIIQQPQVQAGQLPSWLIPALIIGGGIGIGALAYYLYKKR